MAVRKTTILTVDDDTRTLQLITRSLRTEGYEVISATNGQQAIEQVESKDIDLILLDIVLPIYTGFEVCEQIRSFSTLPIIVLTARGQVEDKVYALELGADDYLTKPFSFVELLARVRAVLRRAQWGGAGDEYRSYQPAKLSIGNLTIDFLRHQVFVNNQSVALTPTEYRILIYLAQNAGRVVTYDSLLERVWGVEYGGEVHLLNVNINRLRNKLESDPAHPEYIMTKPGFGYILPAFAEVVSARSDKGEKRKLTQ
jgi:DNA-binding response OmpR family regulator